MAGAITLPFLVELLDDTQSNRDTWVLGLYINNVVIDEDTVFGDLTEASFGGYARQATGAWGAAYNPAGTQYGESDEALHNFTCTGAPLTQVVFGYFLLDGAGNLVGGELNPAGGLAINAAGVTYPVFPRITLENG